MVIAMAVLETAGVASVMPFLAVLGDPTVIERNAILSGAYDGLGFTSVSDFLLAMGAAVFALVLLAAAFRVVTLYAINRYTQMRRHSVAERLLAVYLRQPYSFFVERHSSDLAKSILSEVDHLVASVFKPGFDAIAYALVATALVALLVLINPQLALFVGGVVVGLYALVYLAARRLLGRIGRERVVANSDRFKAAGEALSGIKDIKLLGREDHYLGRFRPPSVQFARHLATSATMAQVPRYLVEAIGVGGILSLALYLVASQGGIANALPVLGVYAFAGYRLLPAVQHIYSGMARVRFAAATIEEVYNDLKGHTDETSMARLPERMRPPAREISFEGVWLQYPNSANAALCDINLNIAVGTSVGLVGETGAGKTSLVDVLLGLLLPTAGAVRIDDALLDASNVRAWQGVIGYVPQNIFLADASIAENIALGVPPSQIDYERVTRCAEISQLHHFVMSELPARYDSAVGERGVKLSGGQRQRIGIARALYREPDVLVLDEATSALDNSTEKRVIDAIAEVSTRMTMIMVAHRLSTVKYCDKVVYMEGGAVRSEGAFETLLRKDVKFREMVDAAK